MGDAYSNWRGHVIVCGLPGVGLRIDEQLTLSGVPAVVVDGMDVWSVLDAARDAVARVRRGDGPVFGAARTSRVGGHPGSDPGKDRPPGRAAAWPGGAAKSWYPRRAGA